MDSIRLVDINKINGKAFSARLADCIILTHDHKILMQQRTKSWGKSAGVLNIFGGHVEAEETIMQGLVRELNEELGAVVNPADVTFIGAVTEDFTNHSEIVHVHFWHDTKRTITGCYEAEAVEYKCVEDALDHPKIIDYAVWALKECQKKGLLE